MPWTGEISSVSILADGSNPLVQSFSDRKFIEDSSSRQRCGCWHGQRCICALKTEPHHLDPVPESGLPPSQPSSVLVDLPKKPALTSTKSESTLTVFRDGHHKPPHKHNDMAHKCGLPYTIPRSHTIHSPADIMNRRSVDHLPAMPGEKPLPFQLPEQQQQQQQQQPAQPIFGGLQRRAKSEHGSPDSAPATEDPTSVPPLDITFFPPSAPASQKSFDQSKELPKRTERPASIQNPPTFGKTPLDQIVTNVPPVDLFSTFSSASTTTSPVNNMAFQEPYQESSSIFASPDCEVPFGTPGFNAPPVDWSSFPIYSDVAVPTSTQTPSYASFDYNSMPRFPAPSSSGDISEADEFGPLPSLGHSGSDVHDLHSVSEASDMDHVRLSSASSYVGLPQAQLLASNDLGTVSIDDFLKSANESTAALEHQLQANVGEPKSFSDFAGTPTDQSQQQQQQQPPTAAAYESNDETLPVSTTANLGVTTSTTESWPNPIYSETTVDDPFYPTWA